MMGPEPIKIPDYFTVSYYGKQKELGRTDQAIADELLISKPLLNKWKKQIGWIPFSGRNIAGRRPAVSPRLIADMRKRGIKIVDIAVELGLTPNTIQYHLNKLGLTKKRA